jgi:autotransporter-associated beta strand protein
MSTSKTGSIRSARRNGDQHQPKTHRRALVAAAVFAALSPGAAARATELFWDANGDTTTATGGTGTWDNSGLLWRPGSATGTPLQAWVDGSDANFPTSPGTVTVSGDKTLGTLTFSVAAAGQNYVLTGTGALNITNTTTSILMATNTSGTNSGQVINCPVSGTDIVVARNMSTNGTLLNLGGTNTWTGNLILGGTGTGSTFTTANKVSINSAGALPQGAGNGILFKQDGSQLLFTAGTAAGGSNTPYTATFNNNINLNASGGSTTFNTAIGATASGTQITLTGTISGTSDLTFGVGLSGGLGKIILAPASGAETYTGITKILLNVNATQSGIVALTANNVLPQGTLLSFAGTTGGSGSFDMAGFNQRVGGLNSTTTGLIGGINNTTGTLSTLTIDGNVVGGYRGTIGVNPGTTGVAGATNNIALVLAPTNTGALTLNGANTYNGGTTVGGGALMIGSTSSVPGYLSGGMTLATGAAFGARIGTEAANLGPTLSTTDLDTLQQSTTIFDAPNKNLAIEVLTAAVSQTYSTAIGDVSGTRGLWKYGQGTLVLDGGNTYTGGTIVNAGTLTANGGSALGATTGPLLVRNINTGAGNAVVLNLSTTAPTATGSLSGSVATPSSGANSATINLGGQPFTVNQTTSGTFPGVLAGAGGFTLGSLSNAPLTLSGVNTYTGGTTVSAGTLILGNADATAAGAIDVADGALAQAQPALPKAVTVSALATHASGKFDLTDNSMVIRNMTAPQVQALIASSYNGGHWNGAAGITSSTAAASTESSVGFASNGVLNLTEFKGVGGLTADDVLVKYTYAGDANLDGKVDIGDLGLLAGAWQQLSGKVWFDGDFTYDGAVNIGDLGLLAGIWQKGVAP